MNFAELSLKGDSLSMGLGKQNGALLISRCRKNTFVSRFARTMSISRQELIRKTLCRFFLIIFTVISIVGESADYFDEFRFPNGDLRPHYADAYRAWLKLTPPKKRQISKDTQKDFFGANPLGPIPRILTEQEFLELKLATEQIGSVLMALVQDHYSGRKSYDGTVIPKGLIKKMIERVGQSAFAKFMTPKYLEQVHFDFGPDFFRDSQGKWRFFEVNTQFIGGRGDLKLARRSFKRRMPDLEKQIPAQNDPAEYYASMAKLFKSSAKFKAKTDGILVYLIVPPYNDIGEKRLEKAFEKEGAIVVSPTSKNKKLVITKRGVYLEEKKVAKTSRKKVDFVYANSPANYLEWQHPAVRSDWILKEAKKLISENENQGLFSAEIQAKLEDAIKPNPKTGKINLKRVEKWAREANISWIGQGSVLHDDGSYPGLIEAILKGRVVSNIAPGMEFVDDKELTKYIPALAKHYGIGDELVATPVRSRSFSKYRRDGKRVLNPALLAEARTNKKKFVIKVVNECAGDGIWVGPNVSKREWNEALNKVKTNPERYELQDYESPSVLGDTIIDTRTLAIVHPKGVYVSDTPVSRGAPQKGSGKVNINEGGHELVVMVVPDSESKYQCDGLSRIGRVVSPRVAAKE